LLEITSDVLRKEKGGNYLLQVWESKHQKQRLVYEKVLKKKVAKWALS